LTRDSDFAPYSGTSGIDIYTNGNIVELSGISHNDLNCYSTGTYTAGTTADTNSCKI